MGVRGVSREWIRSYLENRKQYVSIGNDESCQSGVKYGVPQGSVLGPLLFIAYINDMSQCSNLLNFVHYADDSTAFCSSDNLNALYATIESELLKIEEWMCSNRLSINISKTEYMIISSRPVPNERVIRVRGIEIKRVSSAEFLGVTLDDKLNFKFQVDRICTKLSRATGILYRMSSLVSRQVLIKIYFAVIYPHLTYAITSWGGAGSVGTSRITRAHKRALKIIGTGSCGDYLAPNKLLTYDSVHRYFVLIKMHKLIKDREHLGFVQEIDKLYPMHQFPTRFNESLNLNVPKFTKSTCQQSFLYRGVSHWNLLPNYLKSCNSLLVFKYKLKHHLIASQDVSGYISSSCTNN